MTKCVICPKKLKGKQTRFCSDKCRFVNRYSKNKEMYKANSKNWRLKNPERAKEITRKAMLNYRKVRRVEHNKAMLQVYKNSKQKYAIRRLISYYRKDILEIRGNCCEECKSKENIEIGILDFTWKKKGVHQDNLKYNIHKYRVLCRKCNRKKRIIN